MYELNPSARSSYFFWSDRMKLFRAVVLNPSMPLIPELAWFSVISANRTMPVIFNIMACARSRSMVSSENIPSCWMNGG